MGGRGTSRLVHLAPVYPLFIFLSSTNRRLSGREACPPPPPSPSLALSRTCTKIIFHDANNPTKPHRTKAYRTLNPLSCQCICFLRGVVMDYSVANETRLCRTKATMYYYTTLIELCQTTRNENPPPTRRDLHTGRKKRLLPRAFTALWTAGRLVRSR